MSVEKNMSIDTLLANETYEKVFLKKYGEGIKRFVIPAYVNYANTFVLRQCPNIEEFVISSYSTFTFENGVLYNTSGGISVFL